MRMLEPDEVLEITDDAPERAVEVLNEVLRGANGSWANLVPMVDEEVDQPPSLVRIFSARGPEIPVITVVGPRLGRRPQPASLGLEHAGGHRAVVTLREAGVFAPAEWTLRQDHPRRGLVIELPNDADAVVVLNYALAGAGVLSRIQLPGRWLVAHHRR